MRCRHYDKLFYNASETFIGCAPAIITLALCIAASNLYIQSRHRNANDKTVSEMQCKVTRQSDGRLSIDPQPLYTNDRCIIAQAHAVDFAVPTLFKIMFEGKVSTLSTYFASHRSMLFIAAAEAIDKEDGVDTPSSTAEFVFEGLHKQTKYYALFHGNLWNMRTSTASKIDQIIRYVRIWSDGGPPQKAKLDGTVTAKKKAAHGLDCNPERNSAVVCP